MLSLTSSRLLLDAEHDERVPCEAACFVRPNDRKLSEGVCSDTLI